MKQRSLYKGLGGSCVSNDTRFDLSEEPVRNGHTQDATDLCLCVAAFCCNVCKGCRATDGEAERDLQSMDGMQDWVGIFLYATESEACLMKIGVDPANPESVDEL